MRVLIINTSERIGGAAIAANRLMEALKNNGIKTKMLVRDKQTDQISVVELKKSWWKVWQFIWERVVIWQANHFKKHNLFAVDIANTGTNITALPEFTQADVIHLHWINQGMLSLTDIRRIINPASPSFGQCMICGLLPVSATMQEIAINMPHNATTVRNLQRKQERHSLPYFPEKEKNCLKEHKSPL